MRFAAYMATLGVQIRGKSGHRRRHKDSTRSPLEKPFAAPASRARSETCGWRPTPTIAMALWVPLSARSASPVVALRFDEDLVVAEARVVEENLEVVEGRKRWDLGRTVESLRSRTEARTSPLLPVLDRAANSVGQRPERMAVAQAGEQPEQEVEVVGSDAVVASWVEGRRSPVGETLVHWKLASLSLAEGRALEVPAINVGLEEALRLDMRTPAPRRSSERDSLWRSVGKQISAVVADNWAE
jgi:hypothetical protein